MSKDNKCKLLNFNLYGTRESKYAFLNANSISSINWNELEYSKPDFFFVEKDFKSSDQYNGYFRLGELFQINITGIKTHDDKNLVSFNIFNENSYYYDYRPFDLRYINYDLSKVVRHRYSVMKHMLMSNICLIILRQAVTDNWNHVQVSKYLSDNRIHYSNKGISIVCPLYLYNTDSQQNIEQTVERIPNLNKEIVDQIAEKLKLKFTLEKETITPSPLEKPREVESLGKGSDLTE